MNIMW